MPIITTIDFSTATANTINNIAETVDVENVRFLVADSAGAKYVTLENINANVTARISSHEGVTASTTDAGHVLLAQSLSDTRENVVATAAQVSEAIAGAGGSSVNEEQLLHASVGLDSLAAGPGAVAYCADSIAVGLGAVVGATYNEQNKTATATRKKTDTASETDNTNNGYDSNSVAVGLHAQASGYYSSAYGNFATANNDYTIASGCFAVASGVYATASGHSAKASGPYAVANGCSATASGHHAIANGSDSLASKDGAIASGDHAIVSGYYSIANGAFSTASADYVIASGYYATAERQPLHSERVLVYGKRTLFHSNRNKG